MSIRSAPRLDFWKAPLWLWPAALTAVLCLWSLRLIPHVVSPWAHLFLCAAAMVACWDVLLQGLLPFVLYHRPGRETLPVFAALIGFLASFLISAFSVFHPLPDGLLDSSGGPVLFCDAAATILLFTLAARPYARRGESDLERKERVLPPAVAKDWTLWGSHTAFALAFTALVLWMYRGGTFEMALSASLAALIAADPFFFIDLRAILSVGLDRRLEPVGIRLRHREVLRDLGRCDVVVIQKSEVLTRGAPAVHEVRSFDEDSSDAKILRLAAAAQFGVRHPIRTAIINHPDVAGGTIPRVKGYELISARGVRALLRGRELLCGNLALLADEGIDASEIERLRALVEPMRKEGDTIIFVALDGRVLGMIRLRDTLRQEVQETVRDLRAGGKEVILFSGEDRESLDGAFGQEVFTRIVAGASQEERCGIIRQLRKNGRRVAVVASGRRHRQLFQASNASIDWPAGQQKDDRSTNSDAGASVQLDFPQLSAVVEVLRVSQKFVRRVRHGQTGVALYYLALLPVVTGALQPIGGPPPSPTLAACSFLFLRQLGVRAMRVGL